MMRGERALRILPKFESSTVVSGLFNCVWFSTLKNSARYCSLARSVRENVLCAEKSILNVAGPIRVFLPALPKRFGLGTANDSVVNHLAMRWPREPLV